MRPILAVTLLCSCTHLVWSKPNASHDDFTRDRYDCRRESKDGVLYDRRGNTKAVRDDRMFKECLEARGWRLIEK